MELDNTTPDEKLQRYMDYNEAPDVRLGGLDYIPNKLPTTDTPTPFELPKINTLSSPYTAIKVKDETPIINEDLVDIPSPPADPVKTWAKAANDYKKVYLGDNRTLKAEIAKVESDGMGGYKAQNPTSSAVGKYQFVWSLWGKQIAKYTGVNDPESFKANPEAQEKFFDYYRNTTLEPQLQTIKKEFPDSGLSDIQILKLLHFRGLGQKGKNDNGLRNILSKGKLSDKLESNNLTALQYLKRSDTK